MQSVAAVYNRIEREALRHDREPLYAWLSRRTDNAVKEAIKHGMRMANDPDYRLGVEAGRFAREYADAFEGFMGTGERGQRYRALQEGALRLRAGGDTVSGAAATRREVERLLGVMRAEVETAARATDPTMYVPFPPRDKDGYKIDGNKVMFWATKEAAKAAARSLGWPMDSVTKVQTRFTLGWGLVDGRFGLVSREWLAKNLRPEIISGIYATAGLKR